MKYHCSAIRIFKYKKNRTRDLVWIIKAVEFAPGRKARTLKFSMEKRHPQTLHKRQSKRIVGGQVSNDWETTKRYRSSTKVHFFTVIVLFPAGKSEWQRRSICEISLLAENQPLNYFRANIYITAMIVDRMSRDVVNFYAVLLFICVLLSSIHVRGWSRYWYRFYFKNKCVLQIIYGNIYLIQSIVKRFKSPNQNCIVIFKLLLKIKHENWQWK